MTPAERALYERIRRRAAAARPDLARRILVGYEVIRRSLNERELTAALADGSIERLLDAVNSDVLDEAFRPLKVLIDRQTTDAARLAAGNLPPPYRTTTAFDSLNPNVVRAINDLSTRVMDGLKDQVRETVRQAARAGLEEGVNPRTVARRIRQDLSLAPNQEEAVRNFRRMLEGGDKEALTRKLRDRRFDGTLQKALGKDGTGLRPDQVERMTTAYRKRMEAFNAETQARTAALDAQRLGQRLSWQDAIDRGIVKTDELYRTWVSVGDDRVRPEHVEMDGEEQPYEQPYSNGETVPGESTYNCRCIEKYTVGKTKGGTDGE